MHLAYQIKAVHKLKGWSNPTLAGFGVLIRCSTFSGHLSRKERAHNLSPSASTEDGGADSGSADRDTES